MASAAASTGGIGAAKTALFVLCLVPLAWVVAGALGLAGASLGANPVEAILHTMGEWGLRFLLATLMVTPLRRLTGYNALIRFRRMLGLYALFYVSLHFVTYAWLDQGLALGLIVEDIVERPYITVGMAGLLLMIPLGVTSTNRMMRRLGRRWQTLHRLVYPIAILGVWHFWWQVKQDFLEPAIYAAILALLLLFRVVDARRRRSRRRAAAAANTG